MRQGITTRYLGPTNHKGSRIKATARKASGEGETRFKEMSLTEPRDNGLNTEDDHTRVAKLLATSLGWDGIWVGGGKPEEDGFQYVNIARTGIIGGMQSLGEMDRDWFRVGADT